MVSGRPLLYLSVPGVAFILGVFWFRRRNKNRVDKNDEDAAAGNGKLYTEVACESAILQRKSQSQNGKLPTGNGIGNAATKSMNICVGNGGLNASIDDKDSPTTMLYGKSAPITIQSNGRPSPKSQQQHYQQQQQQHQQQIDSEMLKSKIQDAEHKKLCSIDEDFENLSSPRDLPDSVNNRVSFYNRKINQKTQEPVVIKATRTPKISPENSFLESKYTQQEPEQSQEQNNNCEAKKEEAPIPEQLKTEQNNNNETLVVAQTNAADVAVDATTVEGTTQKRNVDAASPSLSICSVQSGDSGKGSSLPRSEATGTRVKTSYEFYFPNSLIGQLYGRKRTFINQIKAKTMANVSLSKNRYSSSKLRICTIEGTENEIDAALAMIRKRLPARRYPNFTMQRIHYALPQTVVPLSTESLYNLQVSLTINNNNMFHCRRRRRRCEKWESVRVLCPLKLVHNKWVYAHCDWLAERVLCPTV